MIYVTNIMAFPLVLILGVIDMYFLLLFAYWLFGRLAGDQFRRWRLGLEKVVLPFPRTVKHWMSRHTARPIKPWILWTIVVFSGLVLRHVIVMVIASLQ